MNMWWHNRERGKAWYNVPWISSSKRVSYP